MLDALWAADLRQMHLCSWNGERKKTAVIEGGGAGVGGTKVSTQTCFHSDLVAIKGTSSKVYERLVKKKDFWAQAGVGRTLPPLELSLASWLKPRSLFCPWAPALVNALWGCLHSCWISELDLREFRRQGPKRLFNVVMLSTLFHMLGKWGPENRRDRTRMAWLVHSRIWSLVFLLERLTWPQVLLFLLSPHNVHFFSRAKSIWYCDESMDIVYHWCLEAGMHLTVWVPCLPGEVAGAEGCGQQGKPLE